LTNPKERGQPAILLLSAVGVVSPIGWLIGTGNRLSRGSSGTAGLNFGL
jgi:hypothetical protein